jgi:hypothetical protein
MDIPEKPTLEYYRELQFEYLERAEQLFGPKTKYEYAGLTYHNHDPEVGICEKILAQRNVHAFEIRLKGIGAMNNTTDGIFQLSHEVVHLLSPVTQDEGNEVNYLEEGMATYFSKITTETDTLDMEFCDPAIAKKTKYAKALELYNELREIDENAVIKLRALSPVIANIKKEHFTKAELDVPKALIEQLLTIF